MWSGLEGSLASGRGHPYSDIDIRFAIADEDYAPLSKVERTPLLAGLGEYLLLETAFVRALTADGWLVAASPRTGTCGTINGCLASLLSPPAQHAEE